MVKFGQVDEMKIYREAYGIANLKIFQGLGH